MKRLQIYIDESVDRVLGARAVQERTSKAELVRRFVGDGLAASGARPDPLDELMGCIDDDSGIRPRGGAVQPANRADDHRPDDADALARLTGLFDAEPGPIDDLIYR
jgi:hypothetical protein